MFVFNTLNKNVIKFRAIIITYIGDYSEIGQTPYEFCIYDRVVKIAKFEINMDVCKPFNGGNE
jgi:hypothetical protein